MKRESRKTFDIIVSKKYVFLNFRFGGGVAAPQPPPPLPLGKAVVSGTANLSATFNAVHC